jgi:hypothetical protein
MEDILTYAVNVANGVAAQAAADGYRAKDVRIAWAIALEGALVRFVRRNDPPGSQPTPYRPTPLAQLPRRPTDWYDKLHTS